MADDTGRAVKPRAPKAHLADAFRWTRDRGVGWPEMLGAALGMAGPVVLAAADGNLEAGLAAAVGSLMASGGQGGQAPGGKAPSAPASPRPSRRTLLAVALGPALAAPVAAALLAGHGWLSDAAVTLLVGVLALAGGYSRAAAVASVRFVLFLMIGIAVAETTEARGGLAMLMIAGALWTAFVTRALRMLGKEPSTARPHARRRRGAKAGTDAGAKMATPRAIARHARGLAVRAPARLVPGRGRPAEGAVARPSPALGRAHRGAAVGAADPEAARAHDPARTRHAHRRRGDHRPDRIRAAGLALAAGIFVLAGLRPRLRAGNYLAYSAVMTPLIIVLLDRGASPGIDVLGDRLIATLVGAALVIGANLALGRAIAKTI